MEMKNELWKSKLCIDLKIGGIKINLSKCSWKMEFHLHMGMECNWQLFNKSQKQNLTFDN